MGTKVLGVAIPSLCLNESRASITGVYRIDSPPPPPLIFSPICVASRFKIYDFLPLKAIICVVKVQIVINCDLLTSVYDLVLSKVMFSPNLLLFCFFPFDFLPHLQTL